MGLIQYFANCFGTLSLSSVCRSVLAASVTAGVVRLVRILFSRGGKANV